MRRPECSKMRAWNQRGVVYVYVDTACKCRPHTRQAKQLTIQPMHSSMRGQRIPPTPYLTSTSISARTPRVPRTWRRRTTSQSPTTLPYTTPPHRPHPPPHIPPRPPKEPTPPFLLQTGIQHADPLLPPPPLPRPAHPPLRRLDPARPREGGLCRCPRERGACAQVRSATLRPLLSL
ncbi:hypothetical protein K505DRAFT_137791 [Melanomma pulvis-pyrius CBS 109.77]|uniref:Uncharacterized protein n=1 Tax=Melanomma pulvis-pyrius CBS 109.77 TaxID=1314802 RepID=A0A6A6WRW2_9PLEO|nr:hypothetical protein K505DRAFT_137791 [Melanomma pulvis-pyrius CBS 109.77]